MPDDENIIEEDVVRIYPDLSGFRRRLERDLKRQMFGEKVEIPVRFVEEQAARNHVLRMRTKFIQDTYRQQQAADALRARQEERAAQRSTALAERTARARAAAERAATREAENEARRRERAIERENAARAKTIKALNAYRKGPSIIDFGGKGIRPMNLLLGTAAALSPALLAIASNAVQASTSLVALGAAGIGAAIGIGGLVTAFHGLGDVLKLRETVKNEALTKSANAALGDSKAKATELADSLGEYRTALREERRAYAAVHDARVEAARDLENLRRKVIDLNNEYRSSQLSVREAEENERATNQNFFATATQRLRARQDTLDARARLGATRLERRQAQQDLRESIRKGVENADKVVNARDAAIDARRRRQRAGHALQNLRSGADAAAVDKTTSAAAQLEQRLKEMAPAARDIFYWFDRNEKKLKAIQRSVAQRVLPGFYQFLTAIDEKPKGGKTTIEVFADASAELGALAGKYTGLLGKFSQTPLFRESFATVQRNNAKGFDILGAAALKFLKPFTRILAAASPLFPKMAAGLSSLVDRFDAFIARADADGSLGKWFTDAYESGRKWMSIVGNLLRFLKNIFRLSLPSGTSLVDKLVTFTDKMADWSASPTGIRQITAFFEFFRDLPYGKIRDFFVQAGILFTALHTARWAKANPFFAALGLFATSNPALAIDLMSVMTRSIIKIFDVIAGNPAAAGTLLTLLSLAKLGKVVGFDIKIPAVTALKNALTSKFKVLDKFLGGGASTATMHVNAGVVHVYGKAVTGGGAMPGKAGKAGKGARGAAALGAAGGAGGALVTGATLAAVLGAIFGKQGYDRGAAGKGFFSPLDEFRRNPNLSTAANLAQLGSPIGWAGYAAGSEQGKELIGKLGRLAAVVSPLTPLIEKFFEPSRKDKERAANTSKTIEDEKHGLNRLVNNLQWAGKDSSLTMDSIKNYVTVRKARVKEYIDYIRSTQGPIAAAKEQQRQDKESQRVLSELLQQYGWTKAAAEVYTRQSFNLAAQDTRTREQILKSTASFDSMGNALDRTRTKAELLDEKSKVLKGTVNALVGDHVIQLSTKNYDSVKKQLDMLYAIQHVLYNPNYSNSALGGHGADTVSSQNQYLDPKTGLPKRYTPDRFASGGRVIGAGTATSDSIPAWLSHGEYVMPAKTVQKYGLSLMEQLRRRDLPQLAAGGPVMPFVVNLPTKGVQYPKISAGPSGSDQEYTGRTPRGLGAVAGLGERMMRAVIEIHRRFPWASVNSGYRPGAITVTGNKSYHGKRRATDWPPSMELFNYFVQRFGRVAKEIIYSPAGGRQIWNGQPHMYTGAVRNTHWNHVHLALAGGGPVNARAYDSGGQLPPGYTLAYNGTGRTETVRTASQEAALAGPVRIDSRDLARLAAALAGNQISMDGRRVAEVTNRYNYLPAGV